MARILVVEDEDALRELIETVLSGVGYLVDSVRTAPAARLLIAMDKYDLVVTDFRLGREGNGVAVADAAIERGAKAIIITGYVSEIPDADRARLDVLEKPLRLRKVVEAVQRRVGPGC